MRTSPERSVETSFHEPFRTCEEAASQNCIRFRSFHCSSLACAEHPPRGKAGAPLRVARKGLAQQRSEVVVATVFFLKEKRLEQAPSAARWAAARVCCSSLADAISHSFPVANQHVRQPPPGRSQATQTLDSQTTEDKMKLRELIGNESKKSSSVQKLQARHTIEQLIGTGG